MSNVTEFVNNGWVLFSSFDGTRYYSYYGEPNGQNRPDLGVAITNFVRSNKSFKVKLPKGSHTFQLTIYHGGQLGQLSTIRFGVGVETSSAQLPEINYLSANQQIRLDANGEYVVGVPNSGATIRLGKLFEDSASAKQIDAEKYLYITFADDLHSAMVSDSQLNVSMLVGGNEAVPEFIEYFDGLGYTDSGTSTPGSSTGTPDTTPTDATVELDPETGEVLNKHTLLGSGMLAKKHVINTETHLMYTVPRDKSGTINIDMTNLGTNLVGVSIYVGRGSTPTKADLVRSSVPIPREEYDHNAKKMKINYACVESISCEAGDKIWVKVDRMTSIPSVSSSSSTTTKTEQKSVAQMDAGPTWAEIAEDPNLLYPGNTVLSDTVTPTKLPPSPFSGYVSTS